MANLVIIYNGQEYKPEIPADPENNIEWSPEIPGDPAIKVTDAQGNVKILKPNSSTGIIMGDFSIRDL